MTIRLLTYVLLLSSLCLAQTGTIRTIIGDIAAGDGLPPTQLKFIDLASVAYDSQDRLHISETLRLRRVEGGKSKTLAGTGEPGWPSGDSLLEPSDRIYQAAYMAFAPNGDLWGAANIHFCTNAAGQDFRHATFWRLASDGTFKIMGNRNPCTTNFEPGDGGRIEGVFARWIGGFFIDAKGQMYFTDEQSHRVRKVDEGGIASTIAGTGAAGFAGDGEAADRALLNLPRGLAVNADGVVLVADVLNDRIRRIGADGVISTFATFSRVQALVWLSDGRLIASNLNEIREYVADGSSFRVVARRAHKWMTPGPRDTVLIHTSYQLFRQPLEGDAELIAGLAPPADVDPGPSEFVRVLGPSQTRWAGGVLHFREGSRGIRRVRSDGGVENVAPNGFYDVSPEGDIYLTQPNRIDRVKDGERRTFANFSEYAPANFSDLALAKDGSVFVSERRTNRIYKVSPEGGISVFAGNGKAETTGDDGPAIDAGIASPEQIALDPDGGMYVITGTRVRHIRTDGRIRTVMGATGNCNLSEGRPAAEVGACRFQHIAVDNKGQLYFIVFNNHRIYRLSPGNRVVYIAGGGPNRGDGGPAKSAGLWWPNGISFAGNGDLVFADNNNQRIRRIDGFGPFGLNREQITFATSLNGATQEDQVVLESADGETRRFIASIRYPVTPRVGWLSVTPNAGVVSRGDPAAIRIVANPSGLAKGIYTARIRFLEQDGTDFVELPVTMLVSGTAQKLRLSQTGLAFVGVESGPVTLPQQVLAQNVGTGAMPITVTTSTLAGGAWLTATPASGNVTPGSPVPLQITANPRGLAPGIYFGLVSVGSTAADNAPQAATILFQVLRPGEQPQPIVDPLGAIFTSATPRNFTIGNPRNLPINFTTTATFPDRRTWFTLAATSASGSVPAGQTGQITVTPQIQGIPPGQYRAQIQLRLTPVNTTTNIDLLLVVAAQPLAAAKDGDREAHGCNPTRLLPIFQQPGATFNVTAGWPQRIQMQIVDDCQHALTSGAVRVSFNNGDPPVTLNSQGEGIWAATWQPSRANARVQFTARTEGYNPSLLATLTATGAVREDAERPRITPGAMFSEGTTRRELPIAVGSMATIQGFRFSRDTTTAATSPLPARLGETSVLIGGKTLNLQSVADGEVRGQIPVSLPDATVHQAIVQRGLVYSLPETILIAPVQPFVLGVKGSSSNQGQIFVRTDDGQVLADGQRPAKPGDDIVIYATGLGAVDPAVPDGAPGQTDPVSNAKTTVRVQIQGKEAAVKSATLDSSAPGRYAVVATVPEGITSDANASVVVIAADQAVSPAVTMSLGVN